jgi:hypothetical protein
MEVLKKAEEAEEYTFQCQKTKEILQEYYNVLNDVLNSRLLDHKLRQ